MEKLAEKESSSTKHQVTNVEDYEDELVRKSKRPRTDVGTPGATSGMYLINFKILSSHPLNLARSLLRDPSAWRLIMDWAEDKIGYPDFDTRVRVLGSPYIHDEWRPLISAIFASSDPSNEDPRSPSALVEEAMQTHSVSFDKNEGQPSMTSGMYPTNSVDTASHSPNLAGSLLKDLSTWRLIMDWAEDKIGYPVLVR